jgi:hypothetical protein
VVGIHYGVKRSEFYVIERPGIWMHADDIKLKIFFLEVWWILGSLNGMGSQKWHGGPKRAWWGPKRAWSGPKSVSARISKGQGYQGQGTVLAKKGQFASYKEKLEK